jgi:hypothetical protein
LPDKPAETIATAPQAPQPKQSIAPADTMPVQPDPLRTAQPVERSWGQPATAEKRAQNAQAQGDRSQNPSKAATMPIKPSPAWLHAQPYGGAEEASPLSGPTTPDAWMKAQPYREPGVLTPPN